LLEPSIPEGLEVIVQRAMAKRPEDRFGSLADLDRELAAYDDSVSTSPAHVVVSSAEEPNDTTVLEAGRTRTLAMLLGGLAVSLVAGVVLTIFSSLVRIARGGLQTTITGTEAAVAILLVVLVLAAPVALGVLHVKKHAWSSTAAVTQLVRRWRWPLAVSLATYGVGSLLVRVLDIVLLRQAPAAAWPVWDLLMAAVAVGAAAASLVLMRSAARDSRASR
jgi:serine/threonine-protein kinase